MPSILSVFFSLTLSLALVIATSSLTPLSYAKNPTRQKVIDFEDELVEGLNKRPLDSLSQISDRNKKRGKPHLYRKRVGFKTEVQETLFELKFLSARGSL